MKRKLPPTLSNGLRNLGEDLKKARLKRRLKMSVVADRAGISRETLAKIQKGDPGASMGAYAAVIFALGLGVEWMKLADAEHDHMGRMIDDEMTPKRARDRRV